MTCAVSADHLSLESRTYGKMYPGYSRDYRQTNGGGGGVLNDVVGAFSGDTWERSGSGCCCGGGYGGGSSAASSLFSDGTLFALLAAAGLAFYVLYTAVTAAAGTKKRRKRGLRTDDKDEDILDLGEVILGGRFFYTFSFFFDH